MARQNKVTMIKGRYDKGVKRKQNWLTMFQLVGEYVLTRKQNFLVTNMPGEFLTEQLFSSVAPEANRTMASAILGNIWPNGGRSFRIQRPRNIPDSKPVKDYFATVSDILADNMDLPESGLAVALGEYMLDQGAFGISGIQTEATGDLFSPLRYHAINVKNMVVEENINGVIDTIFIDLVRNVDQTVKEYGIDNVSKSIRDKWEKGMLLEDVRILQLIEPRRNNKYGFGNKNMPVSSIHIEWETNKILRESGFNQMPISVARFSKALGEIYGRSPAMFAMSAILRLNLAWELVMRAGEKQLDPPLYLLDNGAIGAGVVDSSAGGLSVFNTTSLNEKSPVGPLFTVGDMGPIANLIEQLTNDVSKAFFIDRLMDLNNQTRMTLGEAQIRDRFRGEGLSGTFKRQETETFSPVINSSFNILLETGLLGVVKGSEKEQELLEAGLVPLYIPEEVVKAMNKGQKVYDIQYVSPANRIMRIEELQGITQSLDITIGMMAGGMSDAGDNLDTDYIVSKITELTGGTDRMLVSKKLKDDIRAARAENAKMQQQIQMAQIGADVAMKGAQAQSMTQGAISGRPKG